MEPVTTTTTTVKLVSYPLVAGIFAYFNLIPEQLTILAILFALDIITGTLREYVIAPQGLSSKVGIIGVLSKLLTFTIPFILALVVKGTGIDADGVLKVAINALIVYEGWSILGNYVQIREKDRTIQEYDAVSILIKKIQGLFKSLLTTMLADTKNSNNNTDPEIKG